ncbi:protein FAM174C [Heteronotia binoei]|uniref:protein FAM174C n=1 Tax=Heteronotia binoei TaxID=13085 RepID=UPI00292F8DF8|nr:protein FAM174C [Heteronotia binoei]
MAARLVLVAALLRAAAAAETAANGTAAPAATPSGSGGHGQGMGPATATPTLPGAPSASGLFGLGLPALRRALFVFLALAALGLLYYLGGRVFRARKPARKKYGLLSNSEDNMEMASLESDEDTLFETRNLRR